MRNTVVCKNTSSDTASQTPADVPLGQTRLGAIWEIYYWRVWEIQLTIAEKQTWKIGGNASSGEVRLSLSKADRIRRVLETATNPQTSSDVSRQLLISLTCFKKNFYYRVIVGLCGNWWNINKTVDTLINRYIIEFGGGLESWLKPNSSEHSLIPVQRQ